MSYRPAVRLLCYLAARTWEYLTDAHGLGKRFGEETLTDINLLDMRRASFAEVQAVDVTKAYEAKSGIDWDWWVGSTKCGWLRYAIQAKKLSITKGRYDSLRQEVKDGHLPKWQIERLENFARRTQSIPAYCFYNGGAQVTHDLAVLRPGEPHLLFGCTVVPLDIVKQAHKEYEEKSFPSLHADKRAIPWHEILERHCDWAGDSERLARHPLLTRAETGEPAYLPQRHNEVPAVIRQLVRGEIADTGAEQFRERVRDFYPELDLPKRVAILDVTSEESGETTPK